MFYNDNNDNRPKICAVTCLSIKCWENWFKKSDLWTSVLHSWAYKSKTLKTIVNRTFEQDQLTQTDNIPKQHSIIIIPAQMTYPSHIPQPAQMTHTDHILPQLAEMTYPDHICLNQLEWPILIILCLNQLKWPIQFIYTLFVPYFSISFPWKNTFLVVHPAFFQSWHSSNAHC